MTAVDDDRVRDLLAKAVVATAEVVRAVRPAQYADPTPCAELDLRGLLNHLIGGQQFFAAAAAGDAPDVGLFVADHVAVGDPAGQYEQGSKAALAAFADDAALHRRATLPDGEPGPPLVQIYLVEQVVHGWDVATAAGQDRSGDPQVVQAVYDTWYGTVPQRIRDLGTVFGAEQPCPPDAPVADRLAAYLGRQIP